MEHSKLLLSNGRFPWFNKDGDLFEPFLVGVAGASASGKTSVSKKIIKSLNVPWIALISMDSFYKKLSPELSKKAHENNYDFDHPNAFDFQDLYETLVNLKRGYFLIGFIGNRNKVNIPIYDFKQHQRMEQSIPIYGANVIIFEGIFALYDKKVRDLMDLKIFVDTDADICLARRLIRDIQERGRDVHGVLKQYHAFVKPSFDEHIFPTMKHADIIIPRGLDNLAAIEVMTKHVGRQLKERGFPWLRAELSKVPAIQNIKVNTLPMNPQLKAIHTIVRDSKTNHDDFIFFADRLCRIVIEYSLSQLLFESKTIVTPLNVSMDGTERKSKVSGVSIVRAGVAMEKALRSVEKDVEIGKILIQTEATTGEPRLHYCKLPLDIHQCQVLLMDASVGTGASALMAIRVLLDHNVKEKDIVFCCLIATQQGIHSINRAFPFVTVVTSEIETGLNEKLHVIPGLGNFGDRYFGTE